MKLFRKIYSFVIFFQFMLFIFFILQNLNSLSEVDFNITVFSTDYNLSFNFYYILAILLIFFGLVALVSLNIFGSGLNEIGTQKVLRYISLLAIISLLSLTSAYYLLQFGNVGLILQIGILISYLFYAIDSVSYDSTSYE